MELLKSGSESSDALSNSNYINVANLLHRVEKSYDKGKKLLDESKITENPSSEQESQLTDVSKNEAEEDDLFRTNDQANDKISANDLAKLGAADRQAVIGYLDKMPSAPISVISNAEDIESQVDLSKEAKMELSELLSDGDTLAGYCRESKKIYIFVNGIQRKAVDFTLQSILVHENAHAIADANAAVDDSFLRRFAGAVERLPSRFYKNIKNIIEESGYESHELYDEIFAVALQRMFQCPKVIERLRSELSSDDCEIFDNILTEQYNGKERYKETVIVGFKHRTDEETNINGLSREDVKNGEVLERNTGRLGRGYSDKSEVVNRQGDGYGAYSDAEVSYLNDPISIVLGKNRFSKKRQAEFAARERQRMVDRIQELAKRMHLDNVEILTDASQLDGKRATAKGFFNKRTGKITIVIPNNVSTLDAMQTLLHEGVAHYGLRQLFGSHFDTFLDNVYEAADESVRRKIAELAAKNGWDFRTATEEYLAGLAEEMNFEQAKYNVSWWAKIKSLFIDMLEHIGFEGFRDKTGIVLTDNELRYLLWRSYENLAEPGRYRSILGEAKDIAKQAELKVGNYAEKGIEAEFAAEPMSDANESFNEQLDKWANGKMEASEYISVGMPRGAMRIFMPDVPIIIRQKILTKSKKKHLLNAEQMKNLPEALYKPIFVFKKTSGSIGVLTELQNESGQNIFVAIEISVGKQLGHKFLEVNDILSIHGREVENIVNPIIENDSLKWVDKEKGLNWLSSAKSNSQAITSETFDSAANIVENFENPTFEDEELFRPGDFTPRDKTNARSEYERIVSSGSYQFQEAVQDSMLGLKKLYQAILGEGTRIENVAGFENAYLYENRMSSIHAAEQHEYFQRYMQPLLKEIGRIAGANTRKRRELTDYIMAKFRTSLTAGFAVAAR